ncbi:MAG: VanW family protein [Firmicutes bacterium]|nr:VanW family protein [Bacillota bacterium]
MAGFNRLAERQRIKLHGLHIKPALQVDRQQFESRVGNAWQKVIKEPENAGFKVLEDDRITIVPGREGTAIDFNQLEQEITEQINTAAANHPVTVSLPTVTAAPLRTTKDIESMGIDGLISQYSTRFNAAQVSRNYNIKVAAAALDGQLIAPGEVFSFNRVVGPRSSEAGYKTANVIVNNELVPGLGGGVCQVSSTLYNAVLLANLKIVERTNHSLPVGYVPIGRDATVSYDAVDFKFANDANFYIYIKTDVTGNNLTVKLYGNVEQSPRVELSSWVVETIAATVVYENDPNLTAGEEVVKQRGSNGFKAAAVRYVWKGAEKTTETLPASLYNPVRRIVAVGTGEARPAVIVPLDTDINPPAVVQPPAEAPAQPLAEPEAPATEPETPATEPGTPAAEPGTPAAEPQTPPADNPGGQQVQNPDKQLTDGNQTVKEPAAPPVVTQPESRLDGQPGQTGNNIEPAPHVEQ